jgi:hypothetical protein
MSEQWDYDFVKLDNGHYAFISKNDDILRTEEVTKEFVKKQYDTEKEHKKKLMQQLGALNKLIENNNVVYDEELEKFIALADKAAKYKEYQKNIEQRDNALEMIDLSEQTTKKIEHVIPELMRKQD